MNVPTQKYITFQDYHSDVKLGCPKCPLTFSSTTLLRSHYKSCHQNLDVQRNPESVDSSEHEDTTKIASADSKSRRKDEGEFKCDASDCGYRSKFRSNLVRHCRRLSHFSKDRLSEKILYSAYLDRSAYFAKTHKKKPWGLREGGDGDNDGEAEQEEEAQIEVDKNQEEMEEHSAKDVYGSTCSICNRVFNKDEYLTHFKVRNIDWHCQMLELRNMTSFQDYHSDVKLGCPKCPQTFSSTKLLRSHYKTYHHNLSEAQRNSEPVDSSEIEDTTKMEATDSGKHQNAVQPSKGASAECTTCSICNRMFSKDDYLTHFKVISRFFMVN